MSKLMIAAFVVAGSVALSGCASLDERLASNDPRVKNEAEHELIASSRENGDESTRVAAVKRITNKDYLYEIAMDAEPSYRTIGGKKISTIAEGVAAVEQLGLDGTKKDDFKKLIPLITKSKSTEVRLAALAKVNAQGVIAHVAAGNSDAKVRQAAWARVNTESGFAEVAKGAIDKKMAAAAFGKLKGQKSIDEVVLKTSDKTILLSGMGKVSDKTGLASRVFSKDLIGDKEVTGKFIADCADDAMLVKIVNEHGEKLTSEQCAAIKAKSKSAEVQNVIAAIADKKILAEIKAFKEKNVKNQIQKDYDKSMKKLQEEFRNNAREDRSYAISEFASGKKELDQWRKEELDKTLCARLTDSHLRYLIGCSGDYGDFLKECLAKFEKIECIELRTQFVTNEIGRMDRFLAERVVPCLKDEDVVSLFKAYDDDIYQRELILDYLGNDRIIPIAVSLVENGAPWKIVRDRLRTLKNVPPEEICRVRKVASNATTLSDMQVFCDIVKPGSIDESFVCTLKVTDVGSGIGNSSNNEVRELVQTVLAKLTPEAKKRMCAATRKKAEAQKGKAVVFGPFYLGMPYLDALLLQEEIWGVDNGVGIWSNFQEKGEHGIYDIASVWKLSFTNKAKFQFIDCKDSLVLPQFIHQFIEGKAGKVSSDFGYVSDIRREFGGDGDDRLYQAYSNTKKGIKVQYCPKDGVLNMVEL